MSYRPEKGEVVWVRSDDGKEKPWPSVVDEVANNGVTVLYLNTSDFDDIDFSEKRLFSFLRDYHMMQAEATKIRLAPRAWEGAVFDGFMTALSARGLANEVEAIMCSDWRQNRKLRALEEYADAPKTAPGLRDGGSRRPSTRHLATAAETKASSSSEGGARAVGRTTTTTTTTTMTAAAAARGAPRGACDVEETAPLDPRRPGRGGGSKRARADQKQQQQQQQQPVTTSYAAFFDDRALRAGPSPAKKGRGAANHQAAASAPPPREVDDEDGAYAAAADDDDDENSSEPTNFEENQPLESSLFKVDKGIAADSEAEEDEEGQFSVLKTLFTLLERDMEAESLHWSDCGREVVVADAPKLRSDICPVHFNCGLRDFATTLEDFDFVVTSKSATFACLRNEFFQRGKPGLLSNLATTAKKARGNGRTTKTKPQAPDDTRPPD